MLRFEGTAVCLLVPVRAPAVVVAGPDANRDSAARSASHSPLTVSDQRGTCWISSSTSTNPRGDRSASRRASTHCLTSHCSSLTPGARIASCEIRLAAHRGPAHPARRPRRSGSVAQPVEASDERRWSSRSDAGRRWQRSGGAPRRAGGAAWRPGRVETDPPDEYTIMSKTTQVRKSNRSGHVPPGSRRIPTATVHWPEGS